MLRSKAFKDDSKLQLCLVSDRAHILLNAVGDHVVKIQRALILIDRLSIDGGELRDERYGVSTANAVLEYKKKRNIINKGYQTKADNIVGKMTIASLDQDMLRIEQTMRIKVESVVCGFDHDPKRGLV